MIDQAQNEYCRNKHDGRWKEPTFAKEKDDCDNVHDDVKTSRNSLINECDPPIRVIARRRGIGKAEPNRFAKGRESLQEVIYILKKVNNEADGKRLVEIVMNQSDSSLVN